MDTVMSFDACFEPWTTCAGPARLQLMQPLYEALCKPPEIAERDMGWAVEALAWIIERAAIGGIPADQWGTSVAFSAQGNSKFGWEPAPETPDGDRGFSQIDALHLLARDLGAIERAGSRDVVTWSGRVWLGNRPRLWRATAGRLLVRGGLFASQCELVLASLLQQRELDEDTAAIRLGSAMIEAAGGEGYLDRCDEMGRPLGEAVTEYMAIGMQMVRTLGSGLRMFDDEANPTELRPWLSELGRSTAIEALRASVATGSFVEGLGQPVAGAWN